jgi:hypothetical protein
MTPKRLFASMSVVVLASSPVAVAQEHAPTLEQCRADVAVWGDLSTQHEYTKAEYRYLSSTDPNRTETNKLTIKQIFSRLDEMSDCGKVDAERWKVYSDTQDFYLHVYQDRMKSFLLRHHLYDQFMKEDDAGQR